MSVNVLITGAGRGIGRGIAIEVAEFYKKKGAAVCINICSRHIEELEQTKQTIAIVNAAAVVNTFVCDIAKAAELEEMISEIHKVAGSIDVLINNAGISYVGLLQDMSATEIIDVVNTNLNAAMILSSQLIPDLLGSRNTPRIINISSVWGNVGASCEVVYSATKGGLNSFTKALAKELAPSHIPVNAIACGYIDTEMNNHLSAEEREELFNEIPAGRPGSPKEIGQTVCLLLEATDYLTGQIITVDGAWT